MRALRPNALPLARQHESRYRTRALLAMVTYRCMLPQINRRAGKIKHFPGVRVVGLILFCFCICFVLRIMYCATLPPTGASRLLSTQASRLMQLGRCAVGGSKGITMNNAGSLDGDHDGSRLYLQYLLLNLHH